MNLNLTKEIEKLLDYKNLIEDIDYLPKNLIANVIRIYKKLFEDPISDVTKETFKKLQMVHVHYPVKKIKRCDGDKTEKNLLAKTEVLYFTL